MTRHQEYYLLNREKRNMERLAIYHNHPDTIAKREERERKKAEKENLKAEKEAAKVQLLQARIQMALERRNKKNGKATNFLVSSPPGAESSK